MERTGWTTWLAIALGSGLGGVLRHLLTEGVARVAGPGFPWGTLVVNLSGSVAIGMCAATFGVATSTAAGPLVRHAVMTGILGGFTTFSTFSVQTLSLLQQGQAVAAAANIVVSVGLGVAGCWLGYAAVLALGR